MPGLAQSGPNGGLVAGTGSHKTELVVGQAELTVYLLEDGKLHESKGTTMRAVIQQAGKTTTVDFADQAGKKLVAKLPAPLDKGAIVVLTRQGPPRRPLQRPLHDQVGRNRAERDCAEPTSPHRRKRAFARLHPTTCIPRDPSVLPRAPASRAARISGAMGRLVKVS